jgi:replicative DNA helicase
MEFKREPRAIADILGSNEQLTNNDNKKRKAISGIHTGCRGLTELTGGFLNSDFIIVGSRPGIGKTSFAINTLLYDYYNIRLFAFEG